MAENKPREFWIYPNQAVDKKFMGFAANVYVEWSGTGEQIHVIEASALTDLQKEADLWKHRSDKNGNRLADVAEEMTKLYARIAELVNINAHLKLESESLEAVMTERIQKLEAALGFYADKNNWFKTDMNCAKIIHIKDCQSNCGGDIARAALKK